MGNIKMGILLIDNRQALGLNHYAGIQSFQ